MNQLLLGYASSDDDDNTVVEDREARSSVVQGLHDEWDGDGKLDRGAQQQKRQKVTATPSSRAKPQPDSRSAAAPSELTATTASRPSTGAAGSRLVLPNPLALLEAPSEEARLNVLGPAASSAPAPLAPPLVRRFPHVVGNYPTVVLLPAQGMEEALDAVYRKLRRLLPTLEPMAQEPSPWDEHPTRGAPAAALPGHPGAGSGRGAPRGRGATPQPLPANRGYHVSLSRTVPIRHPQIAPLTGLLSERLGAVASSFRIALAGLRSFVNDEGSRSFVSVMVTHGSGEVCSLIRQVDSALRHHNLPPFYEVPLPHVSVGWLPGDQRGSIDQALRRLQPTPAGATGKASERAPEATPAAASSDAGGQLTAAGELICSWEASHAVCVVGQREYVVWRPEVA